jgi:hypothetical protein
MLTSIVLLMTVNTVAASAAPFLALLAALNTGHVATTDVARRMESPMQQDRGAAQGTFSLVSVRRPAGESASDEPDGELLRRMT